MEHTPLGASLQGGTNLSGVGVSQSLLGGHDGVGVGILALLRPVSSSISTTILSQSRSSMLCTKRFTWLTRVIDNTRILSMLGSTLCIELERNEDFKTAHGTEHFIYFAYFLNLFLPQKSTQIPPKYQQDQNLLYRNFARSTYSNRAVNLTI